MSDHALPVTPVRRKLLADVEAGNVYEEIGECWRATDDRKVTARIIELLTAEWVELGEQIRPGKTIIRLTDGGRRMLHELALTRDRRRLLAEVESGLIYRTETGRDMRNTRLGGFNRPVHIASMAEAGWVELPPDTGIWRLTDRGRGLLHPDGGAW